MPEQRPLPTGLAMSEEIALRLIEKCSRYLEPPPLGISYYEFWISSEEELTRGVSAAVRLVALRLLISEDSKLRSSAIQALACVGKKEDIQSLTSLQGQPDAKRIFEIEAAIKHLEYRTKSLESLLGGVDSEASFILFARALAKEREDAAKIEKTDPKRYAVDGALDWKNADIASFIYAGLSAFEGRGSSSPPSWKDFAEFLYCGKIIE